MVFLRYKRIKGRRYYYIVESYWVKGGSKQRVLAYVGSADMILKKFKKR